MKKALLIVVLLFGMLGYGQSKQAYLRLGKLTTTEIDAIDVTDTTVVYTAYDTTLGIEVINTGSGWVPRITGGGGSGDVTKVGTPVNNQIAVWTGDGTIEGASGVTWDGTNFDIDGAMSVANNVGYKADLTNGTAVTVLKYNTANAVEVGGNKEIRLNGNAYIEPPSGIILKNGEDDSATAVGVEIDTDNQFITEGSKLLSVRNNNVEKFNIDKDGNVTLTGTVDGRDVAADGAKLDEKVDYDPTLANSIKIRIKDGDILEDYILEVDTTAVASPIEWDEVPTNGSTKAVRSNGIYDAIAELSSSGTFTPTIVDDGGGATYTFTNLSTYYTIGNLVYTKVYFSDINSTGTPSGNLRMTLGDLGTQLGTTLGGDGSYNINLALGVLDSDETKSYYVNKSGNDVIIYRVNGSFGIGSTPISARVVSSGAILLTGVFVKS